MIDTDNTTPETFDVPQVATVAVCEATVVRGINWPETFVGKSAKQPCPNTDHTRSAYAEWNCGYDGNWVGENPDLSRCVSQWSKSLQTSVTEVRMRFL